MNKQSTIGITVAAVIILSATVGAGVYRSRDNSDQSSGETKTTQTNSEVSATDAPGVKEHQYRDGSYTESGFYNAPLPAGREEVVVSIILKEGVVETLGFEGKSKNPTSKQWISQFESSIEDEVVGKHIDEIELDKVSGSSLTPLGFNEAVAKIRDQAAE
ncbi:MAG: hypothetical protein ACOCXT_05150 [Candidatus Dojkabacteria bacterium]